MKQHKTSGWFNWQNWSLTTRLTLVMILLVTAILGVVTFVTIRSTQNALTNQVGESVKVKAVILSEQLAGYFLTQVSPIQALTAIDLIKESVTERNADYTGTPGEIVAQIETLDAAWVAAADDDPFITGIITADPEINPVTFQLKDFREGFKNHVEIFITDRYGATVGATNRLSDYYQADEAWWQAAWNDGKGAVYISKPEFNESAGVTAMLIAAPVYSEETGAVIGIARSTLVVDKLFELIGRVSIGQTGHAVLFNSAGQVIFDPFAAEEGSTELDADLRRVFVSQNSGFTIALDVDRDLSIFGYAAISGESLESGEAVLAEEAESQEIDFGKQAAAAISNLGWATVVRQESEEAFAIVDRIAQDSLIAGALAIVLAGVAAFFVARTIVAPMAQMALSAQEISRGNLSGSMPADTLKRGDEVGILARAFNRMIERLQDFIGSLEERVTDRTRRLELVANLGEQLSAILDFDQLLIELVNQVKERFNYYHAHVYIIDEAYQNLVMTAGVGEAGAQMKAGGHSIPLNAPASLVARAARIGQVVRVDNVREAEDWLPNPLLPDTYSEMAVPIRLGVDGQIVGVLDVQENKIAGLDEGDAGLLRSLANQVAIALNNARRFAQVEDALNDARIMQEQYLEHAWQKTKIASQGGEHLYVRPGVSPLPEATLAAAHQQAITQTQPVVITINGDDPNPKPALSKIEGSKIQNPKSIVAPLTIGNKPIGAFQLHQVDSDDESQLWTDEDLAIVETVLDQVAQAAENLRLFEETRERAGYEQLVGEITQKLREAPTLEALVKTAGEELGQALGVSHSVVKVGVAPRRDEA